MLAVGVLLFAARAASPLEALDAHEKQAGLLEDFLQREVCDRYKAGRHHLPAEVAADGVGVSLDGLVMVTSCAIRPLKLGSHSPYLARTVWELEARDDAGQRCTVSGEGDATFTFVKGTWHWDTLVPATQRRVCRPARRFTEASSAAGLVLPRDARDPIDPSTLMHGGLAVRDFDGDGRPDLVVVTPRRAYLFHNEGDHFSRTPLGPPAPPGATYTMPVAADFDSDGRPDLVLLATDELHRSSLLFHNDGGTLELVGRLPVKGALRAGVATDFNGDGKLDLLLLGYPEGAPDDFLESTNGAIPLFLFGDGRLGFLPRPLPPALRRARFGLSGVAANITGRGFQEVYAANDFGSNDLWWMDAAGAFHESAALFGLLDPGNGMSADLGDVHGLDRPSLYVANMFSKAGTRVVDAAPVDAGVRQVLEKFANGNTLYTPGPDGGFFEEAEALGINRGLWAFGSIFADYDNDGQLDVAVANGYLSLPNRKDL